MTNLGRGDGPESARIMVVGEAWGEQEEQTGQPFMGYSGQLLNSMLHEAGIMRSECYVTNVVNARPPQNDLTKWMPAKKADVTSKHVSFKGKMVLPIIPEGYASLIREIEIVKPDLVIALGNTSMWALTGRWGIQKWRGSQLYSDIPSISTPLGLEGAAGQWLYNVRHKVIPTIHPAAVLREWGWRAIAVNDLRRASRHRYPGPYTNEPAWNFIIRPSLERVMSCLDGLMQMVERGPTWIEFDLETSPVHITCAGLSWSKTDAICIPFSLRDGSHYWGTAEEEGAVVFALYKLLTHQNCWVRGQNLLYDSQHTYRWWHFVPNVKQDTMLSHHSMFSGMKKSLDFQASMYCEYYSYWKELHKDLSNKAGA